MSINIYLNFNGNCRQAVEFYAEVFKTEKPQIMEFGDMPSPDFLLTEETKHLVLHTQLNISGSTLMFSDCDPGRPIVVGNNITLTMSSCDIEEIKAVFDKLKDGGTVLMDLQETFWSKCYGFVVDKFGIGWQVSHEEKK